MELPIYQVDAFSAVRFGGNPAAVVPLDGWLSDTLLQDIAAENAVSETAYVVGGGGRYGIRWFTPRAEVDLCGHATLAAAWVIFNCLGHPGDALAFASRSGELRVSRSEDGLTMDFPAEPPLPGDIDSAVLEALGARPREVWSGRYGLLVFDREADIRRLQPDFRALAACGARPVIATAPGEQVDFVSRFFAPALGVDEDPVTGSAHCLLAPYWAQRLGRSALRARQLSPRGGEVHCRLLGERVALRGDCALYLKGAVFI